ncbi:MAG: carboxypeptidase-like regulatory domain-containing protein [Balneola sp.]
MKTLFTISIVLILELLFSTGNSFAQSATSKETLLKVINDIEKKSDIRFLYREALISNVTVSISLDSQQFFEDLRSQLENYNIGLHVDIDRNQALLYKTNGEKSPSSIRISGYILDAKTGERLTNSTISWFENGEITGIASSTSGTFNTSVKTSKESVTLLFSYVGYESKKIDFSLNEVSNWEDIAIRLEPTLYGGNEIVINGTALFSPADTIYSSLIEASSFSPLGDNSSIKSLQSLPGVLTGPAIEDGLNVRGSSSDGFRVLLDGLTMYNQSHLFGLLDGLNGDVLRSSGFFYDVTPAQFRAPLGGTLTFLTKTGNLQKFNGSAGLSNTSFSGSLEGPIIKGRSSFLLSGRHSYIDDLNWFNNQSVIEYGLDIDRNFEFDADTVQQIKNRNIRNVNGSAFFYDVHGKFYFETVGGSQIILSSYFGKDEANQTYERRIQQLEEEFNTDNEWSNKMIRLAYHTALGNDLNSESSIGFSDYFSSYFKEDNEFRRQNGNDNRNPTIEILPFTLGNELQEFQIDQKFNKSFNAVSWDFGFTYSDFEVLYTEISPRNQSFRSRRTSQLIDIFSQLDFSHSKEAHLNLGSRVYYFSNGKYLKWSPRLKAQLFPESSFSFGLGYSRNYQFMHQLDFQTVNSTDFWVITNFEQPPSSVDYYTSNIRVKPTPTFYFQIEAYYKLFENLRIHSLSNQFVSSFFDDDDTFPFLFNNTGVGKGIELLAKKRFQQFNLSSTYTLSSIELKNRVINDGIPFHPSYDRTHQFSLSGDWNIASGLSLYTSWNYATGTPNTRLAREETEESRIEDYARLDVSVKYIAATRGSEKLEFLFSIYNVLNRKNPWYSEIKPGVHSTQNRLVLGSATIYDFGIQPSFRIRISF